MAVNIVLVEPEIPQNTGNIIRTCACIKARLHLVRPLGFSMDEKHLKRAGLDYIDLVDIILYDSFEELYGKENPGDFYFLTTKAHKKHTQAVFQDGCFIVFGKESKGLSKEILSLNPDNNIRIPMLESDRVRSLNLSNSVAVAAYEAVRQIDYSYLR